MRPRDLFLRIDFRPGDFHCTCVLAASTPLFSHFVCAYQNAKSPDQARSAKQKSPEFSKATELDELDTRYLISVVRYGHNCDIDYLYSNILYVK